MDCTPPRAPAADAAELRFLRERVAELEREGAETREGLARLSALTSAFGRIALQRSARDVIAETLRAARDALGFERSIFFLAGDPPLGRWLLDRIDGDAIVETALACSSLASFSAALEGLAVEGTANELSAPLVDVRCRYVLCAVMHGATPYGFLYADGPSGNPAPGRSTGEFSTSSSVIRQRAPIPCALGQPTSISSAIAQLSAISAVASENAILFERTQALASRDPLTGLLNRRALGERFEQALDFCRRHGASLAYVVLDVDDFKGVNDRGGHAEGDALLRRLATALSDMSRGEDIVARWAGDEFAIVLVNPEPKLAHYSVARISHELRRRGLCCSLGAAVYPRDGLDVETLASAADRALYIAKAAGKNCFAFA